MNNKLKNLMNSNRGAAGVVTALMLVALFISFIAFIQSVYVPKWMEQKESDNMGDLANQFGQLKFSIDTLSVNAKENSKIAVPIKLGSEEMPFFTTVRSYGSLNIIPNTCKIKIIDDDDYSVSHILGSIEYTSDNSYYLDQSYIYENGALILSQLESEIMVIEPTISVIDTEDLSIELIKLYVDGDKSSASGFGTYPIQTKFLGSKVDYINNVKNITFSTGNIVAWNAFFDEILSRSSLGYSINLNNDGISIDFYETSDVYYPDLTLTITEIAVQISPGLSV